MLLVAEDDANGNEFTIQLPSSFGYFERGWALACTFNNCNYFQLDGVSPAITWSSNYMCYGTITASQLLPDVTHTIRVDKYGMLIITYRVP
jgi:hypothetical protein